ncbi:MAG: Mini-ribonuclease 3 [Clostridia bacterium]|nr:Mini-ribonuclease 3 [Clostridia bacterium]
MTGEVPLLTLAYLGDAVLCLKARETLLSLGYKKPCECTKSELLFVQAEYQAAAAKLLLPLFTEEEKALFSRAKNAKSHSAPRHTDLFTYRLATALEAVFGQLHLDGKTERIDALFRIGFEKSAQSLAKSENL